MKIGILGGGQLGRMLALSAHALGLRTAIVDPAAESAAGQVAPVLRAAWDDARARELLASCDVVTYEFENVPADVVASLAGSVAVHPAPVALAATSDRLREKQLFASHGLATPRFGAVDSAAVLERAVDELGLPAVVKTRRFGYDGKGQRVLRVDSDVAGAWRALGPQPLLLEEWIDFDREVSLIAVRGRDGEVRFWGPTENTHVDGILRVSRAPAP